MARRHKRPRGYGWWTVVYRSRDQLGLINLNGTIIAPRPTGRGEADAEVKDVGEPGAGEPHARFDVAAGGNQASRAQPRRAAQAPPADPTATRALARARTSLKILRTARTRWRGRAVTRAGAEGNDGPSSERLLEAGCAPLGPVEARIDGGAVVRDDDRRNSEETVAALPWA